jgi:hypothetical protein
MALDGEHHSSFRQATPYHGRNVSVAGWFLRHLCRHRGADEQEAVSPLWAPHTSPEDFGLILTERISAGKIVAHPRALAA